MIIKEYATTEVQTVPVTSTLRDAAIRMTESDIGGLPVVKDGEVVGFVTDRDLVVRGLALGLDPREAEVGTLMSRRTVQVREGEEVVSAVEVMKENRVRRLMLIDHQDRLAGIVTLRDLARSGRPVSGLA